MKKLTEKVYGAFKSEAELNGQSVSRLPYSTWQPAWTRHSGPISLTGQTVVVPPGGDTVGNQWIPDGVGFLLLL